MEISACLTPDGQIAGGMPKITMPSISASYPRQRLFARLDEFEAFGVIWISAPAGYGKTTAISGYLRSRCWPVIWYQCDEGDGDVASFFHYVTLARSKVCDGPPVPTFLSQYLSAAPTFCRNFFRDWFASLPPGTTLVLDNWQDVPASAVLRTLLPIIAEQLPRGLHIIVISRSEPDSSVSRLVVGERLAQLRIADLELSKSETAAIARAHSRKRGGAAAVDIEALYHKTQGWAAAVTLLLQGDASPAASSHGPLGVSQAIFDFLAAEALDCLNSPIQQFLMSLACLEHIAVPVAQRVSGCAEAGSILETLARQNVFTSYRAISNSYHFHPLFRSFLQRRLQASHSSQQRHELMLTAANALKDHGEAEAGIELLLQARIWHEAGQLVREVAPTLVRQARLTTLSRWIGALPPDFVLSDAWLIYWRGICRLTLDFQSARDDLEHSYERFLNIGERAGQALACAAVLEHIAYTYLDYRGMLPWISRLERLLDDPPRFDSSAAEIQIRAAFMLAISQGMPRHPKLIDSVAHVSALVQVEHEISSLAQGVSALLHFFSRFGRTPQYGDLDRIVERLLDDAALLPLHRLNLLWLHAYQLHSSGDPTRVVAILGEARALARHEGLYSEDTRMRLCELQAQESSASNAAALSTFSELEPQIRGMPAIPRAHFLYVRSIFELGCGNLEQALKYGQEAVPLIRGSHWHIGEALALTGLAEVYCAMGRHDGAAQCIRECALITEGVSAPLVEFNMLLVRAELARIRCNTAEFESTLAQAFAIGREQGYANGFHTSSQLLRRLIPYGIELGMESSYCRWVIAKRRFAPPDSHRALWPWPIKIRAMGRLRIYLNDEELIVNGKAQRKPYEILKFLTAYPNGVEMSRVMDELWPDLDGDAARNSLDIALYRLRRILKSKDAVRLTSGTLALNKEIVWLDTEAFDRIGTQDRSSPDLPAAREEILELYRGGLLGDEPVHGTLLVARDRLRNKFVRRVSQLAKELENTQRWDDLTSLYQRAIDREPAEESLRRGLMHALQITGRDTAGGGSTINGFSA
jgi:ATP/maltotriose-dependent transcriptional regulator MalT/DNA-binding SARP family transcriptional activator